MGEARRRRRAGTATPPLLVGVVLLLAALPAVAQPPPEEAVEVEDLTRPAQEVAAEAQSAETPPAEAEPRRISFSLPFPPERGGGVVTGTTGALEFEQEQRALLSAGVEILYQDMKILAERAEIDLASKQVTVSGNVVITQGRQRLTAAEAVYDLEAGTGRLTKATAYMSPDYFFTGAEIAKVAEDTYTVTNGVFTSCTQEVPNWSFKIGHGRVRVDGFAKVRNAALRVKNVPVLYVPYLLWPVREERTSGFLVPHIGYSDRRGSSLSVAYFQTLGRSYDTTLELDLYSEEFIGFGDEFRYRPSESTEGKFVGYLLDDPVEDEVRWKVEWDHETRDLPFGLRGIIHYQDFSDFNFFRDFERDFDRNTLRFLDSRAFVSGNYGSHSLNILFNQRETFISQDRTVTLDKLPEIEYRLRPTKLGRTPFYLRLDSSLDYLSLERSATLDGSYLRADLFPQVTLPIRTAPWLSLSLTGGERWTFYGDRLFTPSELAALPTGSNQFSGESLSRAIPFGSAEIIGPSFSRIYQSKSGAGGKLKHVIEPRWTYTFLGDFDEEDQIPFFDEVDNLRSTNVGRFSLINRLLAKPAGKDAGSAREILSLELAQEFSFDEEQPLQRGFITREIDGVREQVTRSAGPLLALLRYNPGTKLNLKAQVRYNTLFDEIDSTSLSGILRGRRGGMNLTWFTRTQPDTGESTQNQVRLGGSFDVMPKRLRFEAGVNYDFETSVLQQQRYVLEYVSQCCGMRFEIRDFQAGNFQDTEFRIAISLKNVGTFLDLTGGAGGPAP